jgi:hypothetical protein
MYKENFKRLILMLGVVILCILAIFILTDILKDSYDETITINEVKQGIVVDKNVKQEQSLFYKNSEPTYELILEVTYTYNDEVKTTNVTQIVDKETYINTNINDLFDITTLATITDAD